MKIMIARCPAAHGEAVLRRQESLADVLRERGHQVQLLEIPAIGKGVEAVTNIASHRLLNLAACDVLLCFDRIAAILRHQRKIACLLDRQPPTSEDPEDALVTNLLRSALAEAQSVPAPPSRRKGSPGASDEWAPVLETLGA